MVKSLPNPVTRFLARLSFPRLFLLTAALFLADLVIPDVIPFVDELLLGLGTLLLANWKDRKEPAKESDVIEGKSRR